MRVHDFGFSLRYDSIVQDPVIRILNPIFIQMSKKISLWSTMHVRLLRIHSVQGVIVGLIVLAAWLAIGGHTRIEIRINIRHG